MMKTTNGNDSLLGQIDQLLSAVAEFERKNLALRSEITRLQKIIDARSVPQIVS